MKLLQKILFCLTLFLVTAANYLVFIWVPPERIMGPVQRIFYFHVGCAIACYCCVGIVFVCSLIFLSRRAATSDIVSEAAAEVGFMFCTMVLASGMIWGHAVWNTWFNWEPRLVTFLLLWLILLSLNLLRVFGDRNKIAAHSAVLGVLGAVTVPLVILSIKLLPQVAQLHPQVIATGGLHPAMKQVLLASVLAIISLQILLVWLRAQTGLIAHQLEAE